MSGSPRLEDKQILIVDDDESMRVLVRRMLTRMKMANVLEADGGEAALRSLQTVPVDLVICDWNMRDMSGMELFGRARLSRPNLPFLMVTGRDDGESERAAKRAGVAGFMVKPISSEELKRKISSLLA
jgi:two-component system, chemotaxis family, chemotaxis protein CheY